MAKTKLVSPNVNTRTLPQCTHTHKRPHRTIHLPASLALLHVFIFLVTLLRISKNKKKLTQIGKDLGKCEQEKTMLGGKQLLANTNRIK